jgi:hypothetical protein
MDAVMSDDDFHFFLGATTEDMKINRPGFSVIAGN